LFEIGSINITKVKGEKKISVQSTELTLQGIEGDFHKGNISILAQESIDAMSALGVENLLPGTFGENITTKGVDISSLSIGTTITVGNSILKITQIGREAHTDCDLIKQIGHCILPTHGMFADVVQEGKISRGDELIFNS
jgi:MOSC domain-containing protein YiiM